MQNPTPMRNRAGQAEISPARSRPPGSTLRKSSAPVSLRDCEGRDSVEGHPGQRERGTEEPDMASPRGHSRVWGWGSAGARAEGAGSHCPLPACPTWGPQESQGKSAMGGCGCQGSGTCLWPSRPSKPATQRDSGGTFSVRRPLWVSLTIPISSASKVSLRVVGTRGRQPHPAGPLLRGTGLWVHPHTTPMGRESSAWDPRGNPRLPGPSVLALLLVRDMP